MELLTGDCQEEGNKCLKEEKYIEAMFHYTRGIKLDPQSPHLYNNRSIAFLRMGQFYHALEDAKTVIKMMPKWAKGYFWKGEIECAAENYADAVDSYKQGLALQSDDSSMKASLLKAQNLLTAQQHSERWIPRYGIALGAVVGILLIVFDEAVATKRPIFGTDLIRVVVLAVVITVCYGFAVLYRYFLRTQRQGLLDVPPDFLGDDYVPLAGGDANLEKISQAQQRLEREMEKENAESQPSAAKNGAWRNSQSYQRKKGGRH